MLIADECIDQFLVIIITHIFSLLHIKMVLFVDRDRQVGEVCDVLDSMKTPLHRARVNSTEHVSEEKMTKEEMTDCTPETEFSNCNAELTK